MTQYERVAASAGLRLHLNENTAGCSPKVVAALQGLTRQQAAEYPDYEEVVAATANRLDVSTDEVLLTNGLDEGLLAVSIVTLRSSGSIRLRPGPDSSPEAIVVVPAFDMYAACADAAGGRVVEVLLNADFSFPLAAVQRAITPATRLIFLTSPNNPTGLCIPRTDVLAGSVECRLNLCWGEREADAPQLLRQPLRPLGRRIGEHQDRLAPTT